MAWLQFAIITVLSKNIASTFTYRERVWPKTGRSFVNQLDSSWLEKDKVVA